MVIVGIENGLYAIMYRPALESAKKRQNFSCDPKLIENGLLFPIEHCAGSGGGNSLVRC